MVSVLFSVAHQLSLTGETLDTGERHYSSHNIVKLLLYRFII